MNVIIITAKGMALGPFNCSFEYALTLNELPEDHKPVETHVLHDYTDAPKKNI
jgi:hypothetical protein